MTGGGACAPGRIALALWFGLAASIAAWPIGDAGIGWTAAIVALLPLSAPVAGIWRLARKTLAWAPLTLSPALAIAVTEVVVNEPARVRASISLALILAAFSALIATLRAGARG